MAGNSFGKYKNKIRLDNILTDALKNSLNFLCLTKERKIENMTIFLPYMFAYSSIFM